MQGDEHWTRKQEVRLFLWRKPPAVLLGDGVVRGARLRRVARATGASVN